jgi:hypothetical protein
MKQIRKVSWVPYWCSGEAFGRLQGLHLLPGSFMTGQTPMNYVRNDRIRYRGRAGSCLPTAAEPPKAFILWGAISRL